MDSPRTWTEHQQNNEGRKKGMLSSVCLGVLITQVVDLKAYLGVLHHTLDAIEVREVTDRLVGVVQHSSYSLRDK